MDAYGSLEGMDEGDKKTMLAMMAGHWSGIMNATKEMYEATTRNHKFEKGSFNSFFELIYNQYNVIDYHTQRSLSKFEESGQGKVGCAKGCHYCCFQHLFISTPEAMGIGHYLRSTLDDEGLADVRNRCIEIGNKARGLGFHERYAKTIPCPMLRKKECSIYEVRPVACRTYHSASQRACAKGFELRHKPLNKSDHGAPIIQDPIMYGDAFHSAFDIIFLENGLEVERVEIADAIPIATEPGALLRWLGGERLFQGVRSSLHADGTMYADMLKLNREYAGF